MSKSSNKIINIPVAIVGAGIAGLSVSYFLNKKNIDHVVIEKGEVANTWIKERWDNFYLVNPNWAIKIPEFGFGSSYFPSQNPDDFLSKNQVVNLIKSYGKYIGSKIFENESVNSIKKYKNKYKLTTSEKIVFSKIVILATGAFGKPHIPKISLKINKDIYQIHSAEYKITNSFLMEVS